MESNDNNNTPMTNEQVIQMLKDTFKIDLSGVKVLSTKEIIELERKQATEAKTRLIEQRLNDFLDSLPKRYAKCNAVYDENFGEAFHDLTLRLNDGLSCILFGGCGTGKTQLAVELLKFNISERHSTSLFTSSTDIQQDVTDAMDGKNNPETTKDVVDKLIRPNCLCIDEFDWLPKINDKNSYWGQIFFHVINSRYQDCKTTILTTNLDKFGIANLLPKNILSRFATGAIKNTDAWKNRRLTSR